MESVNRLMVKNKHICTRPYQIITQYYSANRIVTILRKAYIVEGLANIVNIKFKTLSDRKGGGGGCLGQKFSSKDRRM